jgi:outer membrane protein assembly factor BamB
MSLAHFTPPDLFVNQGMVWTLRQGDVTLLGLDLNTGEVKREYPVKDMLVGHHHRCYRNKATERFYLAGEEGIEYIDFDTGALDVHHWMRGACAYGILPANGLIYLPTHSCGCHSNAKLNGFIALATEGVGEAGGDEGGRFLEGPAWGEVADERGGEGERGRRGDKETRAVRGSPDPAHEMDRRSPKAFGGRPAVAETAGSGDPRRAQADSQPSTLDSQSSDWPVYRHDNRRSSFVATDVSTTASLQWTAKLGGELTAPVIAGGRVFVAVRDGCRLVCLDAKSGEPRWEFLPEGGLDTPPSFYRGWLIFGTRAGYVYALNAEDGAMAWRFRAAPADVRLTAMNRLESPWPVHGSVLVLDGKAYCVAGRSMHLNGGMYVFALDVDTGEVLQQTRLKADIDAKGEVAGAVLPDVLVSDGRAIGMRNLRFNPADVSQHVMAQGSGTLMANDGGLLDDTWFNSAFWKYRNSQAQMLVFDDQAVYGIQAYKKFVTKSYPHDVFTPGSGYRLVATEAAKAAPPTKSGRKGKGGGPKPKVKWEAQVPMRAQAMVLTNDRLWLAGAPDTVDPKDPWAAFEDRAGGVLAVFSKQDGVKQAELELPSPPVHDGMAAAAGRLYVSLRNGTVLCYGR